MKSRDEYRTVPDGRRTLDQAHRLEPLARLQVARKLHPPSAFIISQPENWHSFYHPTEGRRLSRPRWPAIYPDGLPAREQSPIQTDNRAQCQLSTSIEANALTTTLRRHPLAV